MDPVTYVLDPEQMQVFLTFAALVVTLLAAMLVTLWGNK